jgi:hypothetical protein
VRALPIATQLLATVVALYIVHAPGEPVANRPVAWMMVLTLAATAMSAVWRSNDRVRTAAAAVTRVSRPVVARHCDQRCAAPVAVPLWIRITSPCAAIVYVIDTRSCPWPDRRRHPGDRDDHVVSHRCRKRVLSSMPGGGAEVISVASVRRRVGAIPRPIPTKNVGTSLSGSSATLARGDLGEGPPRTVAYYYG